MTIQQSSINNFKTQLTVKDEIIPNQDMLVVYNMVGILLETN